MRGHFRPAARVLSSSETTVPYELLLETILQSRKTARGGGTPGVEFVIAKDSGAVLADAESDFLARGTPTVSLILCAPTLLSTKNACAQEWVTTPSQRTW